MQFLYHCDILHTVFLTVCISKEVAIFNFCQMNMNSESLKYRQAYLSKVSQSKKISLGIT